MYGWCDECQIPMVGLYQGECSHLPPLPEVGRSLVEVVFAFIPPVWRLSWWSLLKGGIVVLLLGLIGAGGRGVQTVTGNRTLAGIVMLGLVLGILLLRYRVHEGGRGWSRILQGRG